MNLDQQEEYLKVIKEEFDTMKGMLDHIREKITQYPVYTQLAFIKPLKRMIFLAWQDSLNEKDEFLNNYDGGDKIELGDEDR